MSFRKNSKFKCIKKKNSPKYKIYYEKITDYLGFKFPSKAMLYSAVISCPLNLLEALKCLELGLE